MHSSRMRTVHYSGRRGDVSQHALDRGCVSQHALGRGCVSQHALGRGGVFQEVSAQGGRPPCEQNHRHV